jgi:hypothetical protein
VSMQRDVVLGRIGGGRVDSMDIGSMSGSAAWSKCMANGSLQLGSEMWCAV